jgi:thiol:disulfide interchange protein DsbD
MRAAALAFGLLAGMQAAPAPTPTPVSWSLTAPQRTAVRRGETFTARLVAEIQPGWHLYSINQAEGGPIATEIALAPGASFVFVKAIGESKTNTIFDQSFGMQVKLHTGKAEFTLPVAVAPGAAAGATALVVQIRYQSCTDTLCLPPRTVKVEVPLQIRER